MNPVLKLKFKKLQREVVRSVNVDNIIDFLLEEEVIGDEDMSKVLEQKDHRDRCRTVLGLLRTTDHPQAFVKLYMAIKEESDLKWLIDRFDEMHISAGFKMFSVISLTDC